MFTYLKAKNFKSLKDIEFNLNKTKKKTNQFISIYGENGSGKTNIVELFKVLQRTILARQIDVSLSKFSKEYMENSKGAEEVILNRLDRLLKLSLNLKDYRMIGEKEATEIEYGFKFGEEEGHYYLKFGEDIKEERLYYIVNKQKGIFYELKKNENGIEKNLNNNIFINNKYNEELNESIEQYWGKYSFLSLLYFEIGDKNKEYMKNNISENLYKVIWEFLRVIVCVSNDSNVMGILPDNLTKQETLNNIQEGFIEKDEVQEIEKYEKVLNLFFTQGYADVKRVKYKIEEKEERLYYKLFFDKMIGNELKEIPSTKESEGTRRILKQFNTLMGCLQGRTVIIDEIDNGIHDLLMKNIIMSIKDEITGQLVITTHNTLLLEVLPKDNIYILSVDYKGNKKIHAIKDYDIKIQKNHNARDLYLKGLFGGIPLIDYIDFEEIKFVLQNSSRKDGNIDAET